MARSSVPMRGLCLLNRWPEVMREVGYRFNQISGDGVLQLPGCPDNVYVQYEREYIAQALLDATTQAAEYLGYLPMPMWVENEVIPLDDELAWDNQTVSTHYGHLQEFGTRATTLIDADADVTYTDEDDDGVDDTATITVSGVTAIDADEIKVFYRTADGADSAAAESWQIEPLTVVKSGDTATITAPRYLFSHPALHTVEYTRNAGNWTKHAGDVANEDDFVWQVDVYRVYADATQAVTLLIDPRWTDNNEVAATGEITLAEHGYFTLQTETNQTMPEFPPAYVKVSYRAGLPLVNGRMDAQLENAIVRYANTLMPQMPSMCDRGEAMWKDDEQRSSEASIFDAWNPPAFGTTKAGMKLLQVVNARQNRLKGKLTRTRNG